MNQTNNIVTDSILNDSDNIISSSNALIFDARDFINTSKRINRLIANENNLLKEMRLASLEKSFTEKMELLTILENYKNLIYSDPLILKALTKKEAEQLKEESTKFEMLLGENGKLMHRAEEVHKIVMSALKKVLQDNALNNSTYNKRGVINTGRSNKMQEVPAVSINESL